MNKKSFLILEILLGLTVLIVLAAFPFTLLNPIILIDVISVLYIILAFIVMFLLVLATVSKKDDPQRGVSRNYTDVIKNLQFLGKTKVFEKYIDDLIFHTNEIEEKTNLIRNTAKISDITNNNGSLILNMLDYYYDNYYRDINILIDNIEYKDIAKIDRELLNHSFSDTLEEAEKKIVAYIKMNVLMSQRTVKELDHLLDLQQFNKQLRSLGKAKKLEKYTNTAIVQINDLETRTMQLLEMLKENFGADQNSDEIESILEKYRSVFYANLKKILKRLELIDTTSIESNLSVDENLKKEAMDVYQSHVSYIEEKTNMDEKITIELEKLATELSRINDGTGENNLEPLQDYINALKSLNDNTTDDELTKMMSKY